MPREKSFSCSSLRDISLKFVATNIHLFQLNALKELPETLIRELYEECYDNVKLHNLPSELFVTASTLRLHGFRGFDLSGRKILNKVCEECKNLRELYFNNWARLEFTSEKFSQLFMSIPKIKYLYLDNVCNITDQHLSLIGQHCPLLRHLRLEKCKNITDEGLKLLSNTQIHHLELMSTNITPEGCVIALKNLKKLTTLIQDHWDKTIQLLQAEVDTGGQPVASFSIESIDLGFRRIVHEFNVGKTIAMLFPKLKELHVYDPRLHTSFIFLTQNLGKNLTEVNILNDVPLDMIRVIGHFCPILESLSLSIDTQVVESYDKCSETPCDYVPYQCLRKLSLSVNYDSLPLPREWLEMLLKNCHLLETLFFHRCDRICDDFSFVMQLGNPFRHLNKIMFTHSNQFSLSAVQILLEFLPAVRQVSIFRCLDYSDLLLLQKYVKNNNWDLFLHADF